MVTLKNDITLLKISNSFDFAETNLILNRHFEHKINALKLGITKLNQEWKFEEFTITLSGKLNSSNPNSFVDIIFAWPESLEPEVNIQIQSLKDNFFSKK